MFVLIFCTEQHHSTSYQQCVLACCGQIALVVCSVCIFLLMFGADIMYLVIIGNQWDKCKTFCSRVYICGNPKVGGRDQSRGLTFLSKAVQIGYVTAIYSTFNIVNSTFDVT